MTSRPPLVFFSHSHEDKDRFVIPFATALRAKGVEAWVDEWEMLPGDSLVDKIFEEGLKDAAAIIVVLSAHSIKSKWVREELNAAVVARIEKGTRLIPILLDNVEVPQALKNTVWVVVRQPADFQQALAKVVDAIFQQRTRPPLGPGPGFAQVAAIAGLRSSDTLVFKRFGDRTLELGHLGHIQTEDVWHDIQPEGIDREAYVEVLGGLGECRLPGAQPGDCERCQVRI
jgi:hypothetical protein